MLTPTVTAGQLAAYAGALAVLVATPGPVVAALIARSATGGVRAAVPLATGVAVGDVAWPLAAMLGIGVVSGAWAGFLTVLRYAGAAILVWMGVSLVRKAGALAAAGRGPGREGGGAGVAAGVTVIAGNPKGMQFYAGVGPGWVVVRALTVADVVVICHVAAAVPLHSNHAWAALFGIDDLAKDQGRQAVAPGSGAVTLARNFATEAEVDAAFALALEAGATAIKRPEKVFWGGYSGYFADPDGHVWELAMNPFWPLAEDGTLTLPGA
jgi:threonine/homoserine/homoserine lactone efflux protein